MIYLQMRDESVYTIGDIYNKNKTDETLMLSNYPSDFWKPYRDNYSYFDRRFKTLYKSFYPYDQETEEGLSSVVDEFRMDVYAHLMANDKRYSELFRVQSILDNDAYSLTNNVDYTESTERDLIFDKGSQENEDDFTTTIGSQENTEDLSKTYGISTQTTTNTVSAFNTGNYEPDNQSAVSIPEHTETEDNTLTSGSREDTHGGTHTEGTRHDVTDDNITVHKVGNMGVQTVDDMLLKHWENWDLFDFYKLIFSEIARDLLRGC